MTSSLRKKRRTTRWSRLRWSPLRLASAFAILILVGSYCRAVPADDNRAPAGKEDPAAASQLSPLDRLKQRSAAERWRQRSSQWPSTVQPELNGTDDSSGSVPKLEDLSRPKPVATRTAPVSLPSASEPSPTATEAGGGTPPPLPDGASLAIDDSSVPAHVVASREQEVKKYPEPVRDPEKLKKITEILPHRHYEPNPEIRKSDPCANLCPRPDGKPCEPKGDQKADTAMPACPEEIQLSAAVFQGRVFSERMFCWAASDVYYNPLFFEDHALERYGHTHGDLIQPFVSVGKFGVQLLGAPYFMTIDPPWKTMYPLGFYRPGECAPKKYYQIPWNSSAFLSEAGVWTALIFIIP